MCAERKHYCLFFREEEAALSAKKPTAQKGKQPPAKKPQPAGDSAGPSSGTGTPREVPSFEDALHAPIESFSASNIDDALELLSIVNQKNDKASEGSRAAQSLDAHPERRYKAALAAYKERELPIIKKEQPGLRLNQYEERIFKAFKKSPENPYNVSLHMIIALLLPGLRLLLAQWRSSDCLLRDPIHMGLSC